jgi:acyl-CoA thioester hydrolase
MAKDSETLHREWFLSPALCAILCGKQAAGQRLFTPESPMRLYSLPVQATDRDIDGNGHVNNIVYLQWMQEVAIAHSRETGCTALTSAAGGTWVARSHRIEYLRPAFAGDRIDVQSWVVDATKKSSSPRRYRMVRARDGALLAKGETLWVFVDGQSGRPRSIPAAVIACFEVVPPDEEP